MGAITSCLGLLRSHDVPAMMAHRLDLQVRVDLPSQVYFSSLGYWQPTGSKELGGRVCLCVFPFYIQSSI